MITVLETPRLRLYRSHDRHRDGFARMHADAEVMADLGGPISRATSDLKLDRYISAESAYGTSRWAVETRDGEFIGYEGVMRRPDETHPLGDHVEVGWRFRRQSWGHGFATESARYALRYAMARTGLRHIVAYTGVNNLRSQAVIARLGMVRDPSRDFTVIGVTGKPWAGLVWESQPNR